MPELPEVEVTRRGVAPHIEGRVVEQVVCRREGLRWPFPAGLSELLAGRRILGTGRRGKYLLVHFEHGTLIVHLGMSGHLRVLPPGIELKKHDHFDLVVSDGHQKQVLRLHDPRRFGALLYLTDALTHPLLANLGPEPLDQDFSGGWLYRRSRGRRVSVKSFIMDNATVVGVGNIYAQESLFLAGIHPSRPAGRISEARYQRLALAIRSVLAKAIEAGGTTLRDFTSADGQPGYFAQQLLVYGRAGEPCPQCAEPLRGGRHGQRSTVYCPRCQR